MQEMDQVYRQTQADSKSCLVTLFLKIPQMLIFAVAGALLGSGLYLLITTLENRVPKYSSETEYYIDFAEGRLEAKDYYNGFTWNDVLHNDEILGKMMESFSPEYQREEIGNMITGEILSDVRYLIVTIKGTDPELVELVSQQIKKTLEQFAIQKDEFDQIYQVEDLGVKQIIPPKFTKRAILLGAVIGFFIAFLYNLIAFCVGDRFYTKTDVIEKCHIPCLGMQTKKGNRKLDEEYQSNLEYVKRKHQDISVIKLEEINSECYEKIRNSEGVVIEVPFARTNVRQTCAVLQTLNIQDCKVLGIVITQADDTWLKLYGMI